MQITTRVAAAGVRRAKYTVFLPFPKASPPFRQLPFLDIPSELRGGGGAGPWPAKFLTAWFRMRARSQARQQEVSAAGVLRTRRKGLLGCVWGTFKDESPGLERAPGYPCGSGFVHDINYVIWTWG